MPTISSLLLISPCLIVTPPSCYLRQCETADHSNADSFNDPAGMCPNCQRLGIACAVAESKLVDDGRSPNEGAITFPVFKPGTWLWKAYADKSTYGRRPASHPRTPTVHIQQIVAVRSLASPLVTALLTMRARWDSDPQPADPCSAKKTP